MSAISPMNKISSGAGTPVTETISSPVQLGELTALASAGLPRMLDPVSNLFCHRMVRTPRGLVREGVSLRYTAIVLLGLHRLKCCGKQLPVAIQPILDTLLRNGALLDNIGDVGLVLWLLAEIAPDRLKKFYEAMNLEHALERHAGVREGLTMEISWFLTGLSCAAIARREELPGMTDLAAETYCCLEQNVGESGIFGHQASRGTFGGMLRGRIGSFADQMYAIYAISRFVAAFEMDTPLSTARNCAEAMCGAQGPRGEWWWHYDSFSGEVVRGYPVFSVHQDAMAPMALLSLGKVIGEDFSGAVAKGIQWVGGQNELGIDLRDMTFNVIWSGIRLTRAFQMYLDDVVGMIRTRRDGGSRRGTAVLGECRPYELGWLLHAFAEEAAL
jgi:hypothetical protein